MQLELDHLPRPQQEELQRVKCLLLDEFEKAVAGGAQPWRRKAKVLKIVLFGSYARNDWVDDPENGYQSDFDLLIVVNDEHLTDIADYWYVAEDKILRDAGIGRTVNIIVHTLQEVNRALAQGEYFWADVVREGVPLYEIPGHAFAQPTPPSPAEAWELARRYFENQSASAGRWLKLSALSRSEIPSDPAWAKNLAFNLHQSVETSYACFLLTTTLYFPRSHNIKFLRSLAEDKDKRLVAAWPRELKMDRRRFELLKRAYVEARYSPQFDIRTEDLDALLASAKSLQALVRNIGLEHIEKLRREAAVET